MVRALLISCLLLNPMSSALYAQQEVTLKTGTRMIGSVSIDGDSVSIKIGDEKVTMPLSNVDLIAPVGVTASQSPERLLMMALESRLHHGPNEGLLAILAEANRAAPEDPRISYWYAQSLLDSGYGSEANNVLRANHHAIVGVYPGMADRLARAITERVKLESLPRDLVDRMDQMKQLIASQRPDDDRVMHLVRFRLIDQHQRPIEESAFRLTNTSSSHQLESFDLGHYLLRIMRNRSSSSSNPRLIVSWPGLESKEVELRTSSHQISDAGEIKIRRFEESEQGTVTFTVTARNDEPIKGARITATPSTSGTSSAERATAATDEEGRAKLSLFPGKYTYTVAGEKLKSETGSVEIGAKSKTDDQKVTLYPLIEGKLRVEWMASGSPNITDAEATFGESVLHLGSSDPRSRPMGMETVGFLRPMQIGNRAAVQFAQMMNFGPIPGAVPWVKQIPIDTDDESIDAAKNHFAEIELKSIASLREKGQTPDELSDRPPGPHGAITFAIAKGEIYVGEVIHRDPRTGQPTTVAFKFFVEEVSQESSDE